MFTKRRLIESSFLPRKRQCVIKLHLLDLPADLLVLLASHLNLADFISYLFTCQEIFQCFKRSQSYLNKNEFVNQNEILELTKININFAELARYSKRYPFGINKISNNTFFCELGKKLILFRIEQGYLFKTCIFNHPFYMTSKKSYLAPTYDNNVLYFLGNNAFHCIDTLNERQFSINISDLN